MPINVYGANDAELARLRDMARERAKEQRLEADNAQSIANRDERVVAGEDTERAATTAANLARQELGGAAGRGAAALAGMEAAQKTRSAEFANLLQRARERKDTFEQKAVDRRQKSYDMLSQSSSVEQARIRDNAIAAEISRLQEQRKRIQQDLISMRTAESQQAAEESRRADRELAHKINSGETPPASQMQTLEEAASHEGYPHPENTVEVDPLKSPEYLLSKGFPERIQVGDRLISLNGNYAEYIKEYPNWLDENYSNRRETPDWREYSQIDWSDKRLKKPYKGAGNNAGHSGNAERSAAINKSKAEEMFADMGNGVNDTLARRYHG